MYTLVCCRFIPRSLPDNVEGDSKFLLNYTVLKIMTGLSDTEVIYTTYRNKASEILFRVELGATTFHRVCRINVCIYA